jgi:hypothetical protein
MPDNEQRLKVFISHKMDKDGELAEGLAKTLRKLGGRNMEVIYAQELRQGSDYRKLIDDEISETDIFILLYTGLDIDWQQCLVESGQFKANLRTERKSFEKRIVVLHSDRIEAPKSLNQFSSVRAVKRDVQSLLTDIFIRDQSKPKLCHYSKRQLHTSYLISFQTSLSLLKIQL